MKTPLKPALDSSLPWPCWPRRSFWNGWAPSNHSGRANGSMPSSTTYKTSSRRPRENGRRRIGRVETIQLTTNRVLVRMKVRADAEVKTDSTATVKFTGLLGQNFVSIDFGTPQSEPLKDNQYVTTAEQADLSAMMQKIDNVCIRRGKPHQELHRRQHRHPDRAAPGPHTNKQRVAHGHDLQRAVDHLRDLFSDFSRQRHAGQTHQRRSALQHRLSTISNLQDTASEIKGDGRRRAQDRGPG